MTLWVHSSEPAKRVINFHSDRPGPPGGPDGTRPVRFHASWNERLPADARFAVGDRVELQDVGRLPVIRVDTRAKVRRESETLHLVWLDDGSQKHTPGERIDELKRQYWREVRKRAVSERRPLRTARPLRIHEVESTVQVFTDFIGVCRRLVAG